MSSQPAGAGLPIDLFTHSKWSLIIHIFSRNDQVHTALIAATATVQHGKRCTGTART